jgi:hypothetical protein
MFEHAQHVEEEMRTAQIHDQENWRENGPGDGGEPHGCARNIDMMKQDRCERDHRRHPGNSAKEKVERNFPCPDRRFDHGLTVVTWFTRNRAARNIDAASSYDAFSPSFLAQLFEPLFGWRIGCHEKNANARRVAMIDAIAVANAEAHADFR